jgi:hypothetical protein
MKDVDTPSYADLPIDGFLTCGEDFSLKQLAQHEYTGKDFRRLGRLDSSCTTRMANHEKEKPEKPAQVSLSVFPRYGQLRRDVEKAWAKHRVIALNQALTVAQRISPTLMMADSFYAQTANFEFCDDGICNYDGPIFVHLEAPNVAPLLAPGMRLQYVGLKTYTTVLGASQTIPEFWQVEAKRFPDVLDACLKVDQFKPTPTEAQEFVTATEKEYTQKLMPWVSEGLRVACAYLAVREQLVDRILKPWVGVRRYSAIGSRAEDPVIEGEVPEDVVKNLPGLIDNYEKTTDQLLRVLQVAQGWVGKPEAGTVNATKMYEYARVWVQVNIRYCGSGSPDSWNPSTYPWEVFKCWATPRFELPRIPEGQNPPNDPTWWSKYQSGK